MVRSSNMQRSQPLSLTASIKAIYIILVVAKELHLYRERHKLKYYCPCTFL